MRAPRYDWERTEGPSGDAYAPGFKPIYCIDFDGTLMKYAGWHGADQCLGDPIDGALEHLVEVVLSGRWDVHIFSSRSHQQGGVEAMRDWMVSHARKKFHGTQYETVVSMLHAEVYFPRVKPPAIVSLDERTITFGGTYPTLRELHEFTPFKP